MMTKPLRLLILDDNLEATKKLATSLGSDGVVVYSTDDPEEAGELLSLLKHDILLVDVEKLIRTPVYPLETFRQTKPDLKIVGISNRRRGDTGLLMELLGLDAYVHQPVTPETLITSLPEISDRYLMVSTNLSPEGRGDEQQGHKWQFNPMSLLGRGGTPTPQV